MTTIAYKHSESEIAFDSRITQGPFIVTDSGCRSLDCSAGKAVLSGTEGDYPHFISDFCLEQTPRKEYEVSALLVHIDSTVSHIACVDGSFVSYKLDHDYAIGSGAGHAITAMDMGTSAKEAVAWAIKRDSGSGGTIVSHSCPGWVGGGP